MILKTIATTLIFASASSWAIACDNSENSASLQSKLAVIDTTFNFSKDKDHAIITSIGTIKNATTTCADDIVIEAKYFDAKGTLVDVHTENLFGVVVPAGQEVAFRVRGPADRPKEIYAKAVVRVASVSPQYVREPEEKSSKFLEFLYWWGPVLLLLGLAELLIRRQTGKNSPQQKMVHVVEQQMMMVERNTAALERIANTLEKRG